MPPSSLARLVPWLFTFGETIAMTGINLEATFPDVVNRSGLVIEIDAVGGDLRYRINGPAGANAHGFVPQNGARIIGPLQNWESLGLFGAPGTDACLTYYREKS